jgi:glyoxylase-like metal-dependent hydrolase (beta-lactamase superfamily II)
MRASSIHSCSIVSVLAAATLAACSKPAEPPVPEPAAAPAAAPAPRSENAYAFNIGELSAYAVSDGYAEFPNDNKIFGLGRTAEEVNALLTSAGLPVDKLQLTIHPLLVKSADRVLMLDAGTGGAFGPTAGKLVSSLAEAGVEPQGVTDILISHSHGDHVGGLVNAEGALTYPNATIHMTQAEWDFMADPNGMVAKNIGAEKLATFVAAVKPKLAAFAPGAELVPGVVKAVEIKGHTPGHSGYLVSSGADSLLYVGDSMHHYVLSVQKPDWVMAFDGDQATGAASRAALIADSAAKGQRIYAVHFPFPGMGKFEKRGDGFVWVAE